MEVIKESSAEKAVLEWLKAELNSARFSEDLRAAITDLGCDEGIITEADINNEQENEIRWRILKAYRTWLDRNFDDYDWQEVELSRDEVSRLNYIDYSYWNELSDGTRKVGQAAMNIAAGKIVFDVPNDRFFAAAKLVEAGESFPPIIVVSGQNDASGEILEGHMRATGHALAGQAAQPLRAIWGKLRN